MKLEGMSARRRVAVSVLPGLAVAVLVAIVTNQLDVAAVGGWDLAALVFLAWTWNAVWRMDQPTSARHAETEDPTRGVAELILLGAALASLGGVGIVLVTGKSSHGAALLTNLALAVVSIAVSWAVVHTTYTLRYARMYYEGVDGGIDFHDDAKPTYKDFAYLAFTIGMTFQVSDTEINDRGIRAQILKHALISYLFGAVILAVTINLLAGLSK